MNNKIQVIVVGENIMFLEAKSCDYNVPIIFTDSCQKTNIHILNFLRRVHLSKKINKIINIPFKQIWAVDLSKFVVDIDTEYYFIFNNATLYPIPPKRLVDLKNKCNVHYIMLWGDPYDSVYSKEARFYFSKVKFDYIFDINYNEAAEKGFIYTYLPYNYKKPNNKFIIKNDIYFAGAAKDRLDFLLKIYEKLTAEGVSVNYQITGVHKNEQRYNNKIIYNKQVAYKSILDTVYESNCILEVLGYKQTGATLRYYEAVVNNKKLLTNNKNVVNLPFYNPKYMYIFETVDDIDTKWIIERENIDYHYDGRFLMSHFVDKIIAMELEKE